MMGRLERTGLPVWYGLGCPLVLGDDRHRVDLGRGLRAGREGLLVPEQSYRPVAVGKRVTWVAAHRVPLVLPQWLGADHEVHVRPQVRLADLDDVVALLAEGTGDGPFPVHRDVREDDPHPQVLHLGDDLREFLLGADHQRVTHRTVAREGDQVAMDLALHTLTAARPHPAEPELHPGEIGKRFVVG
jgi:hypothetical protein